jgi:hypothetical protein
MQFLTRYICITLFLCCLSTNSIAIEVLGFELTSTSRAEFLDKNKNNSSLQRIPSNDDYTPNGYMIDGLVTKNFPHPNRAAFIFDAQDRLCAVVLQVPTSYYDQIFSSAKKNYRLVGQDSSKSGRRESAFASDTDRIAIDSTASAESMVIMYMNKGFHQNNSARIRDRGFKPKFEEN